MTTQQSRLLVVAFFVTRFVNRLNLDHVWIATLGLLRDVFRSDADVIPDSDSKTLEIRLHTLSNPRNNRAIEYLLAHLNAAESTYPGTEFRLRYSLGEPETGVTSNSATDQDF